MKAYFKHLWHDDPDPIHPDPVNVSSPYGPIDAARLGDMEDGIYDSIMGSGLVFNPMHSDYGAVGDGVTDDAARVQAAANDAAGNGVLYLPGAFGIGTAVSIGSDTKIIGLGKNASALIALNGVSQVVKSDQVSGMRSRIVMRDFSIVGDGSTSGQIGLNLAGVELSEFSNLRLSGFTGTSQIPLLLTSWSDSGTYRPVRENAFYGIETSGVNGIKVSKNGSDTSTSGSNNNKFFAPRCFAYTNIGINIDAGEGNSIYGAVCSTPTDATTGIRVNDDVNALYNCNTDTTAGGGNTCVGVKVESGVNDTFIMNRTGNGPTTTISDSGTNTIIFRHPLTHIGGTVQFGSASTGIGFFGASTHGLINITGSRGGNAALANLLTALANYGLITDSTS